MSTNTHFNANISVSKNPKQNASEFLNPAFVKSLSTTIQTNKKSKYSQQHCCDHKHCFPGNYTCQVTLGISVRYWMENWKLHDVKQMKNKHIFMFEILVE